MPRGEKSMLFSPRPCATRMRAGRIGASGPPACRSSYSAVPFVASMDSLISSTGMSMRYEFSVAFTCGERFA